MIILMLVDKLQYKMTNFCYWDAKSKEDLIIIIVNQSITATIGITAFLRMPTILQLYRQKNERIKTLLLVHVLVLLWSIIQSIVNFYSIGIFVFKLSNQETVEAKDMIEYSHAFAIICSFPGFIVQTLFITICYKYCSNILKKSDVSSFSNFLYWYCLIRVIPRITIIIFIICSGNQDVGQYSTIQFILLITDSGIINTFLIGFALMFILKLQNQHLSQLKNEYLMMVICSLIRIIIDLVFLLAINTHSNDNNLCVSSFENHLTYSILYNLLGNVLMHFVPIAIILKIYKYDLHQVNQPLLLQGSDSKNSDPNITQPE